MVARLIIFNRAGTKAVHQLSLHHVAAHTAELKLVLETSTEHFEAWLFYFLRDHGAYIETSDPAAIAAALNLSPGEDGIVLIKG